MIKIKTDITFIYRLHYLQDQHFSYSPSEPPIALNICLLFVMPENVHINRIVLSKYYGIVVKDTCHISLTTNSLNPVT